MANNPYVNKVVKADGTTIIDISDTTAAAADVAVGKYFYTAAGAKVEGTNSGTIPAGYADVTPTTAVESDVKFPKKFVKADGTLVTGTANKRNESILSLTSLPAANWTNFGTYYHYDYELPSTDILIEDDYYSVVFDGVEYLCQAYFEYELTLGAPLSENLEDPIWDDYPFRILSYYTGPDGDDDPVINISAETGGNHTLSISHVIIGGNYQTKSVNPSETAQTVTADAGYDALQEVDVAAISSTYVGSSISRRSSSNLSVSGSTVTAPSGYYQNAASISVPVSTIRTGSGVPSSSLGVNGDIYIQTS